MEIPREGSFCELLEDIEPIPKGVYKVRKSSKDYIFIEAGEKVLFSISGHTKGLIRPLGPHRGTLNRTPQSAVLDRYYELLEKLKREGKPFDPSRPLTGSYIDPSVAREVH